MRPITVTVVEQGAHWQRNTHDRLLSVDAAASTFRTGAREKEMVHMAWISHNDNILVQENYAYVCLGISTALYCVTILQYNVCPRFVVFPLTCPAHFRPQPTVISAQHVRNTLSVVPMSRKQSTVLYYFGKIPDPATKRGGAAHLQYLSTTAGNTRPDSRLLHPLFGSCKPVELLISRPCCRRPVGSGGPKRTGLLV